MMDGTKILRTCLWGVLGMLFVGCAGSTVEQRADWLANKMERELALNPEQKAKLAALKEELLSLQRQPRLHGSAFLSLLGDSFDESAALEQLESHLGQFRQAAERIVPKMAAFYNSLSAEQKKEFREWMADHGPHRRGSRRWHSRFYGGANDSDG